MTAPPTKRPVLVCQTKHRHPDELTARAAAMTAIQRFKNAEKLWVYQCTHCNGWHLTSKNIGRRAMVTADNPIHTGSNERRSA